MGRVKRIEGLISINNRFGDFSDFPARKEAEDFLWVICRRHSMRSKKNLMIAVAGKV